MALADARRNAMLRGSLLAMQVVKIKPSVYLVPSQSEPGVRWPVIQAKEGELRCPCPAGWYGKPCAHASAVIARRAIEAEKRPRVETRVVLSENYPN